MGGAEISLGPLVAAVGDRVEITVLGLHPPVPVIESVALRQLHDRPDPRQQMGQCGRHAMAHSTSDCMTDAYLHLWQAVLHRPPVPRLRVLRPRD
jgi:hypothetical protein